MVLDEETKTSLNVVSEATVLTYVYSGTKPREVLARVDVGSAGQPLSGAGGTYYIRVKINGVPVYPSSPISVPTGPTRFVATSRAIPIVDGDTVTVTVQGLAGETAIGTYTTLRDVTGVNESETLGAGDVLVDHDYGGTDALAYKVHGPPEVGIPDATIRAYRRADYDAGRKAQQYVLAQTTTDADGRWLSPFYLNPGDYTLTFWKPGSYGPTVVEITVA